MCVKYLRNKLLFGILQVSCKVSEAPKGFRLTLQETRSINDSMNIPKVEFIAYIFILQCIINI